MASEIYQAANPDAGLTPLPSASAPSEGFAAVQQFASEGDHLANVLQRARDMTLLTQAETEGLQAHAALEQKYTRDADHNNFSTAPAAYREEAAQTYSAITSKYGSQLSPIGQAQLNKHMTQLDISSGNAVNRTAFSNEASTNVANWQTQAQLLSANYLRAGSQAERDAITLQGMSSINNLVHGGWITPEQGGREAQQFSQGVQEAYVAKTMQTDPDAAKAMLADPAQLTKIPAERRIALQNHAQAALDETGALKLSILGKVNPPAAMAAIGRIAPGDTVSANHVFDSGVIWQESRGDPNAISPKGAAGIAQVMPGTGRQMAAELATQGVPGMAAISKMSDGEFQQYMKGNPEANKALGRRYWLQGFDHEGGYLPGAMAFYNAGPGNTDRWMKVANDKFGNDPTPAQFLSVVDIKETHDYISAIYQHLGAPTDGFGLTGNAHLRAQSQTLDLGRQEDAQFKRALTQSAAAARSDDPLVKFMQDGYPIDPVGWSQLRNAQNQAAALGDPEATKYLRQMDRAEAVAPLMKEAWASPPSQVAAAVSQMDAQLRNSGVGVTQAQVDRLNALKSVQSGMDAMKQHNTVGLAERQGLFKPTPILAGQIGTPAFADALAARGPQTLEAARAYDGNVVPFKPEEVPALKTAWDNGGPADKANLAATLAANLKDPQVYEAGVRQIAGGDRLEMTAGLIGANDPALAQKILVGAEMLKDKGVETKIRDVRSAITQAIPVGLYPNIQTNSDVAEAVAAVYAANKGAQHALIDKDDAPGIKAAMEEVTGPQASFNGRVTPIPKPFAAGAVQHVLDNLSEEDVKPLGGLQPGVDVNWLGKHAQLMPLKLGGVDYQVLVDGKRVLTADGRNLQVNLGDFAARQTARLKAQAEAAGVGRARSGETDDANKVVPGL